MKTYLIESVRFDGDIRYTFNSDNVLVSFSAENADIDSDTLLQIVSKLPPTYEHLCAMVQKASQQKTLKAFQEVVQIVPIFDTFWDLYPRRVGKIEAEKQWNKMKDADKMKAVMYIKRYKTQADKAGVAYLYPSTYLTQRRWED